jgi:hypothetical protein
MSHFMGIKKLVLLRKNKERCFDDKQQHLLVGGRLQLRLISLLVPCGALLLMQISTLKRLQRHKNIMCPMSGAKAICHYSICSTDCIVGEDTATVHSTDLYWSTKSMQRVLHIKS